MDFAFGEVTPKKFIYNYVAQWKDLRSSSMCACFWKVNQPWIYLPRFWIGEVYWEKFQKRNCLRVGLVELMIT